MSIVAITGNGAGGDEEFARRLADRLGYPLVSPAAVLERAAAWGAGHRELLRAAARPPGLAARYLRRRQALLALLRAAVAAEARSGKAVCYGLFAELLPAGPWVVRVHLRAPLEARVTHLRRRLKLNERQAGEQVRRADRTAARWRAYLHGSGGESYDLVLGLDRLTEESACEAVAAAMTSLVERDRHAACRASLADFGLAARVEAALLLHPATAGLAARVSADSGAVAVEAAVRSIGQRREVERVALAVPGIRAFTLNGRAPGWRRAGGRGVRFSPRRLWPVAAAAALAAWVLMPWRAAGISGTITDTRCGGRHAGDTATLRDCVTRCVREGGAEYALYDGRNVFLLSDQKAAAGLAGARVRVTGELDKARRLLRVASIRAES